jgi:hypothetical protein
MGVGVNEKTEERIIQLAGERIHLLRAAEVLESRMRGRSRALRWLRFTSDTAVAVRILRREADRLWIM